MGQFKLDTPYLENWKAEYSHIEKKIKTLKDLAMQRKHLLINYKEYFNTSREW